VPGAVIENRDMLYTYPRLGRSTQKRYRNLSLVKAMTVSTVSTPGTPCQTCISEKVGRVGHQVLLQAKHDTLNHKQNLTQFMRSDL